MKDKNAKGRTRSYDEAAALYWKMLNDGAWRLTAEQLAAQKAELEKLKQENAHLRGLLLERGGGGGER
jgi:hypothetical protein